MATKSVKVHPVDQKPNTNLQIITGVQGGFPVFGPHPNQAERVKIASGAALEVLDPPMHSGGTTGALYYYIDDSAKNGNFRRYFIRADDVQ